MDIDIMKAEDTINGFIEMFSSLSKTTPPNGVRPLSDAELAQFVALLNVVKTVYIAQLSVQLITKGIEGVDEQ